MRYRDAIGSTRKKRSQGKSREERTEGQKQRGSCRPPGQDLLDLDKGCRAANQDQSFSLMMPMRLTTKQQLARL